VELVCPTRAAPRIDYPVELVGLARAWWVAKVVFPARLTRPLRGAVRAGIPVHVDFTPFERALDDTEQLVPSARR
jgi:hypothetical protein